MKRLAGGLVMLGLLGGTAHAEPFMSSVWNKGSMGCSAGGCRSYPMVPDVVGPWGQPVPMAAPHTPYPEKASSQPAR